MRLAILGGGGFRVPLVHRSLLDDPDRLVDELVLHDVAQDRLRSVAAVLDQQAAEASWRPRLRTTTDLRTALAGADFVFSAIRVGGLSGRVRDERIALRHGLIGQETVGVGGVCYALRTVPVALRIATAVTEVAPDAWVINFTNPAGIVTEAMAATLGDRVIGICDSPVGLCRRVARALNVSVEGARFDYLGLNHLGWLRGVRVAGRDRLPELLADDAALASVEEGALFGASWLRTLRAVPNEYLRYYYLARETLEALRATDTTRGEFLRRQQEAFYTRVAADPSVALTAWTDTLAERERTYHDEGRAVTGRPAATDVAGGGYERVALELMTAVATNRRATLILNVPGNGAVSGMDGDAVVEVPCAVDASGARPYAAGAPSGHMLGLMRQVKACEQAVIYAATHRSREHALLALAGHPLTDSIAAADQVLDAYTADSPDLADLSR